jgi:hypothetical protein
MASPIGSQFCPYCGATNPAGYNFCQQCHKPLPASGSTAAQTPWPTPADSFQLVTAQRSGSATTLNVGRGTAGLLFIYLGIPFLLLGIGLLIGAGIAAAGTASYDATCSMIPNCTPAPDISGGLAAGGVVVLLIGILLMAYGFSQYRSQSS